MRVIAIDNRNCSYYEENMYNDNAVLMSYMGNSIKTWQMKKNIDMFIDLLSDTIEVGNLFDERLSNYSTAMTVFKSLRLLFDRNSRQRQSSSKEEIKITIDVVKEIILSMEKNPAQRNLVRSISLFAKIMLR